MTVTFSPTSLPKVCYVDTRVTVLVVLLHDTSPGLCSLPRSSCDVVNGLCPVICVGFFADEVVCMELVAWAILTMSTIW